VLHQFLDITICTAYDICLFIDTVKFILHKSVPCKIVRLKPKDSYFVTPLKSLLVKHCPFRKHGHREQADALPSDVLR